MGDLEIISHFICKVSQNIFFKVVIKKYIFAIEGANLDELWEIIF